MKFTLILLIAGIACILAAPVSEEKQEAEPSVKAKRGLHLGLGYHAPLITHSHYVAAPTVVHHAPIISHASVYSHAPLIAHHPVSSLSYHLPSYHSIHHF